MSGFWGATRYALGRFADEDFMSDRMAAYIREHTVAKARILSPNPGALTVATGRPNASGFASVPHIVAVRGPAYADAVGMLDPAAIRRLEIDYVHATEEWLARLPPRALRRLENPDCFELLTRDGPDALYRVRPAFRQLDADPASAWCICHPRSIGCTPRTRRRFSPMPSCSARSIGRVCMRCEPRFGPHAGRANPRPHGHVRQGRPILVPLAGTASAGVGE